MLKKVVIMPCWASFLFQLCHCISQYADGGFPVNKLFWAKSQWTWVEHLSGIAPRKLKAEQLSSLFQQLLQSKIIVAWNCLGAYVYHYSITKIKKWILFVTYIYYWVVYSWHHSLHSSKSCHRRKQVLHWLLTCMTNIPSSRRKSNCSSLCCNIFSRWAETCPAPAKPLT